jgi:hypothetical protein
MQRMTIFILLAFLWASALPAAPTRFIVDDEEYLDGITRACVKLLDKHKLLSLAGLRDQVVTKGHPLKLAHPLNQKLTAPELCDRLRESTMTVGALYRCPDCGEWHFNGSVGFVVAEDGILCTCCHVILGEDEGVKEAYMAAADASGHVFPVQSVLAADTDADTCFVQIDARGLKPLPLRSEVRVGERVYCLSHPGGFHFMFTEGMVSRLNRRRDQPVDSQGKTNETLTRPVLYLNVSAEFAPGSSGAAIVDEAGNAVGQVSSMAESGEPTKGDENTEPSPSVPIRFCIAADEILRLSDPHLKPEPAINGTKVMPRHFSHSTTNRAAKVVPAK